MTEFLRSLREHACVGVVGGSDLPKICQQLAGGDQKVVHEMCEYVFAENGLVAFKGKWKRRGACVAGEFRSKSSPKENKWWGVNNKRASDMLSIGCCWVPIDAVSEGLLLYCVTIQVRRRIALCCFYIFVASLKNHETKEGYDRHWVDLYLTSIMKG